ncbi:phenylacetaldoxime dehydratase family protein [Aspergillus stella-maris]|uniref:phenylacetaldoxime dehydratase family protein n=1 Tax=Aspergillus stella-maris TaxID=1810926 RepID=UPI003CCD1433
MSRKYPLAKPPRHKPPMERWKLDFSTPTTIHTTYIGVQRHDTTLDTLSAYRNALETIELILKDTTSEKLTFLEGDDAPESTIWVSYSTQNNNQVDLLSLYQSLSNPKQIGLWKESFTTPTSRLETNYSGLDYLPGLARLPGTNSKITGHELTAYWGAARDRIPNSATDLFGENEDAKLKLEKVQNQESLGRRLHGTNTADNIVHIRSGQFWENCSQEESAAYEENLQPALMHGLRYVWENRTESGALGLRFLRNTDQHGHESDHGHGLSASSASAPSSFPRGGDHPSRATSPPPPNIDVVGAGRKEGAKETCASGFFRNLTDLEKWAKGHPSHHKIFNGAIQHARRFGESRKFRTWHEVSVLKAGEAEFEYLNCVRGTGVTGFLELRGVDL